MTLAPAGRANAPDTANVPGFAVVPNAVLRDGRFDAWTRLLYAVLDGRGASKAGGIRVGLATLAADLGASESTVKRSAEALEDAGWLDRRRTGRTSAWRLRNGIRMASQAKADQAVLDLRPVTADPSDRSPVTSLQRSTREDYNNNGEPAQPAARSKAAAAADPVEDYRLAVNQATGVSLSMTRALERTLRKISAAGIPAAEAGLLAAAWVAAQEHKIESKSHYLCGVILPALAEGVGLPEHEPQAKAPTVPSYREMTQAARCTHGAEAGRCALCRREELRIAEPDPFEAWLAEEAAKATTSAREATA